jgi:enolase
MQELIVEKYGLDAANVGDEGGFAPPCDSFEAALDLLTAAIGKAGYEGKVKVRQRGALGRRRLWPLSICAGDYTAGRSHHVAGPALQIGCPILQLELVSQQTNPWAVGLRPSLDLTQIGMDPASSEFYREKDSVYDLRFKCKPNDGSGERTR